MKNLVSKKIDGPGYVIVVHSPKGGVASPQHRQTWLLLLFQMVIAFKQLIWTNKAILNRLVILIFKIICRMAMVV